MIKNFGGIDMLLQATVLLSAMNPAPYTANQVHRHTVFYRLRQISEISGHDLDSAHDQLTLRTAMAIDALDPHER